MNRLQQQVRWAHRRLMLQQFARVLPGSLFATLLLAAAALALPKLWPLDIAADIWTWSWLTGATIVGVLLALTITYTRRQSLLEAAIEIDQRCQLRERISTTYALSPEELQTPIGQALVQDALRRASQVDLREPFRLKLDRRAWLPLIPAAAAFLLVTFVPDRDPASLASAAVEETGAPQVKRSAEELRKKLAERRQAAAEQGLRDAEGLFQKLEEETRKLTDTADLDQKKGLVELNDLARELEQRRQTLGGPDKLQEQLKEQLKNLQRGPAEKLAQAMREGDFQKAQEELTKLQEQLRQDGLSDEQKQQLAQQLEQMQQKLAQLADAQQQAIAQLEQQIEQARNASDPEEAARLQEQLDKLAQQGAQQDRLNQLAAQLGQAAESIEQGETQQAAEALEQLAQDLSQVQQELGEMELLDQALEQIAQAKDAMTCPQCEGAGCEACQGAGHGQGQPGGDQQQQQAGTGQQTGGLKPGVGHGSGRGPEELIDADTYDTRVQQNIGRGPATLEDFVAGPNVKGQVRASIQAELEAAQHEAADPLTSQRLPRTHREHARDYFNSLREGD